MLAVDPERPSLSLYHRILACPGLRTNCFADPHAITYMFFGDILQFQEVCGCIATGGKGGLGAEEFPQWQLQLIDTVRNLNRGLGTIPTTWFGPPSRSPGCGPLGFATSASPYDRYLPEMKQSKHPLVRVIISYDRFLLSRAVYDC